ncbi:hypothetical protein FOZ62_012712 [Perkinsus olseni]|uniref:Uncharacterized protein n=1 Tax=Perkinsus olseni TaxID=32597 RepID=A0A7J6N7H3_PEROL|nr:hypothetical protein FOZ62_012712 [Perkinsus olseni]
MFSILFLGGLGVLSSAPLSPGWYLGRATDGTRRCWPDMVNLNIAIRPLSPVRQKSSIIYTGRNGLSSLIASGYPKPYSNLTFANEVYRRENFYYINGLHYYPKVALHLAQVEFSPRIPFRVDNGGILMYLDARQEGNRKFYHLDCPIRLEKVNNTFTGLMLSALSQAGKGWPVHRTRAPVSSPKMVVAGKNDKMATGGTGSVVSVKRRTLERSPQRDLSRERISQTGLVGGEAKGPAGSLGDATQVPRGSRSGLAASRGNHQGDNVGEATKATAGSAPRKEMESSRGKRKPSPERSSQADTKRAKQARAEDGRAVERLHRGRRPATGSRRLPRPFHKQGVTEVGKVIVEGRVKSAGGKMILSGPVTMTFESTLDHSYTRLHLPGLHPISTHAGHNTYFGLRCFRPWQHFDGLSKLTPELATAEGIMQIGPLRVDNIYICINSGMWRIHLGEETVDGLGREVVLPLVDVDDPFDPLD